MANLTLAIDDDLLRRARIRALERGTSVNALVREYLTTVAGSSPVEQAIQKAFEIADRSSFTSGPEGRTWTRDELYER